MKEKTFKLVRSTDPIDDKTPFIVVFGEPGVGKTSLSFTAQKPVLHFDFDKGISRAVQKIRPDFFALDEYGEIRKYIFSQDFETMVKTEGYKAVALDTIGTLLDNFISPWIMRNQPKLRNRIGALTLQGWGFLASEFNRLLTRLRSLGLLVVAICHAKEVGDDDNKQMKLAVKGGSAGIIYQSCDMLGYMYISGNARVIDFNPRETHPGKNVAALDVLEIPDASSPNYDDFFYDQVIEPCITRMKDKSLAQIKLNESLETWRSTLEPCKTIGDFTDFIKSVKEIPEEEIALLREIRVLLSAALKSKKLKYNKETGKVEKIKA